MQAKNYDALKGSWADSYTEYTGFIFIVPVYDLANTGCCTLKRLIRWTLHGTPCEVHKYMYAEVLRDSDPPEMVKLGITHKPHGFSLTPGNTTSHCGVAC